MIMKQSLLTLISHVCSSKLMSVVVGVMGLNPAKTEVHVFVNVYTGMWCTVCDMVACESSCMVLHLHVARMQLHGLFC